MERITINFATIYPEAFLENIGAKSDHHGPGFKIRREMGSGGSIIDESIFFDFLQYSSG